MASYKKRNSGFSLLETLLTVAILVILLGVSFVGIARHRDYLKITELDNAARDIYMAAENRAVLLQNSGATARLLSGGSDPLPTLTLSAVADPATAGATVRVLSSKDTPAATLNDLVPLGSIDPTLRDGGGQFVVLYDETTHHVKEVFYAEREFYDSDTDNPNLDDTFRKSRSDRVAYFRGNKTDRCLVGWYSSDLADEIGTRPLPAPGVDVLILNDNELTLTVRFTMPELPAGLDADSVGRTASVRLDYKYLAPDGSTQTATVELPLNGPTGRPPEVSSSPAAGKTCETIAAGETVSYTWVLDSLRQADDGTYTQQFKGLIGAVGLGGDFTVTAGLKLKAVDSSGHPIPGYIDSAYYAQGTDNSLFAKGSTYNTADGTAKIANLRHLQNLHSAHSNAGSGTVKAEQLCDIDCEKARDNNGDVLKDSAGNILTRADQYNFLPIVNSNLASCNGQKKNITSLKAIASGSAGLFGDVSTNLKIMNCRVLWLNPDKLVTGTINYKVSGANAGGLIGHVANHGDVTIQNSFAATTVKGTGSAGGLVGQVSSGGSLTVTHSYADCYLNGNYAGGLIGYGYTNGGSVSVKELKNCYAAGFITDSAHSAGLVNGGVTAVSGVYSVVRTWDEESNSLPSEPTTKLYSGATETTTGVRYLYSSAGLTGTGTPFGGWFEYDAATPETHVYDLRHKRYSSVESLKEGTPPKDKTYPYPGVKDTEGELLPHYCDWADLEESPAGLVYYEMYSNGSYGVYGQHEDSKIANLKADTDNLGVARDGYALVFSSLPGSEYTIMYGEGTDRKWTLTSSSTGWKWTKWKQVTGTWEQDGEPQTVKSITASGRNLIPLPDEIVTWNLPDTGKFYQKLTTQLTLNAATNRTFYFNPHFARSVHAGTATYADGVFVSYAPPAAAPADPKGHTCADPNCKGHAYVRAARHLYDLSVFQSAAYNYAGKGLWFEQELDVDYSAYAKGYPTKEEGAAEYSVSFTGSFKHSGTAPYKQAPIGSSSKPFTGTYDGGCHIIRNVFFKVDTETYLGLFGETASVAPHTLKNIVYDLGIKHEAMTAASGKTIGTLVGKNSGSVTNCAVYGVDMETSAAFVGGLAGLNDGTVKNCAAEVVSLTVNGSIAGGLVGHNAAGKTVSSSFAVGKMEQKSSVGPIAGLVGSNDGKVNTSYAALNLISDGYKYGLCPGFDDLTKVDNLSGWFKDAFVYRGEKYNTTAINSYKDPGKGVSLTVLKTNLSGTGGPMSEVTNNTVKNFPIGSDGSINKEAYGNDYKGGFPYLTGVTGLGRNEDGVITSGVSGNPIHYGLWPAPLPAGLAYYEMYGSGNSATYGAEGSYEGTDIKTLKNHGDLYDPITKQYDTPVTRDGYALVFKTDDIPEGVYEIKYGSTWTLEVKKAMVGTVQKTDSAGKKIYSGKWTRAGTPDPDIESFAITKDGTTYTLFMLPDTVNTEYLADDKSSFYQRIVYGEGLYGERTFYFNHHFARTVKAGTVSEYEVYTAPSKPTDTPNSAGNPVYVRTPRHLYALSRFQNKSWYKWGVFGGNWKYGQDENQHLIYDQAGYYFLQELDLDYNTYQWYGKDGTGGENGNVRYRPVNMGYYYKQPSITIEHPDTRGGEFAGTYDGGSRTIRNVFYDWEVYELDGNENNTSTLKPLQYLGLFKFGGPTNVTYEVPDNITANLVNGIDAPQNDGYQDAIKVGTLAGGMFTPKNCSVKMHNLTITSSNADVYVGGVAGYVNWGTGANCHVEITGKLSVQRIGNAGGYGNNEIRVSAGGMVGIILRDLGDSTGIVNAIELKADDRDRCAAGGLVGTTASNSNSATSDWWVGERPVRRISNCHVEVGTVSVTGQNDIYGGGLAGFGHFISNCSAVVKGSVTVTDTGWVGAYAGGLAGGGSNVQNCSAIAATVKAVGSNSYAGGLLGTEKQGYQTLGHSEYHNTFPDLIVKNSYAAAAVLQGGTKADSFCGIWYDHTEDAAGPTRKVSFSNNYYLNGGIPWTFNGMGYAAADNGVFPHPEGVDAVTGVDYDTLANLTIAGMGKATNNSYPFPIGTTLNGASWYYGTAWPVKIAPLAASVPDSNLVVSDAEAVTPADEDTDLIPETGDPALLPEAGAEPAEPESEDEEETEPTD